MDPEGKVVKGTQKGADGRGAQRSSSPAAVKGKRPAPTANEPPSNVPKTFVVAVVIVALAVSVALGGAGAGTSAAGKTLDAGERLATLVSSVKQTSWAEGTPLAKKLQHSLARSAKGSAVAEGVRSFVVGGDRTTAADRTELIGLLDRWVGVHSGCELEGGWRVDVDGGSLDAHGVEKLLQQLASAACAATLVVLSSAEQVHIDVMQQFEPLLSGEGSALTTEVILVLDVEVPATTQGGAGAEDTSACTTQRDAKRYKCMEQKLQDWIRSNIWKRRGLLGRITQWIPFG